MKEAGKESEKNLKQEEERIQRQNMRKKEVER